MSGLVLEGVKAGYGAILVLKGISLTVEPGEIVCLLGGNAAGKTTTMMTIMGVVPTRGGAIAYRGRSLVGVPTSDIVAGGIAIVPEGRRVFPRMTVEENLELGAYLRTGDWRAELEGIYQRFPRLKERRSQAAGTLSGGEQQMLAIGRALMARPSLILMDEPSMGLAPALVDQVFDIIAEIGASGVSILLVEQNARKALTCARRGYVIAGGQITTSGPSQALLESEDVQHAYLGG